MGEREEERGEGSGDMSPSHTSADREDDCSDFSTTRHCVGALVALYTSNWQEAMFLTVSTSRCRPPSLEEVVGSILAVI